MSITQDIFAEIFALLPRGLYLRDAEHIQRVAQEKVFTLPCGTNIDLLGDWEQTGALSRSLQRQLHMHCVVGDLIQNCHDADPELLCVCLELAEHWAARFSYVPGLKHMAYHDETTARRIAYWLRAFVAATLAGNDPVRFGFHKLLLRDLAVLARDDFFAGCNNHGMFQDLTLLYASVLGLVDESLGSRSVLRLQEYLLWCITPDGVHKEHSPAYHFIVASQFFAHLPLIDRISSKTASELAGILQRMGPFAEDIALPTGELPPIGDTSQVPRPDNYKKIFFLEEKETQSQAWAVYKDGGYAIFRTMPTPEEEGIYALFTAAHHGAYHKHSDDLALLLYRKRWILSEGGPFGYDYAHPHSRHAYSNFAHNTLVIDKTPLLNREQGIGNVFIASHGQTDRHYFVEGVNERTPGVTHKRTITFSHDGESITIADTILTEGERHVALLWHTPLQPKIEIMDGITKVCLGDEAIMAAVQNSGSHKLAARVVHGEDDSIYKSFSYPQIGSITPTFVIVFEGIIAQIYTIMFTIEFTHMVMHDDIVACA